MNYVYLEKIVNYILTYSFANIPVFLTASRSESKKIEKIEPLSLILWLEFGIAILYGSSP